MNKLLIVDDDKTISKIILKVLNKKININAEVAHSFSEAKEIIEKYPSQFALSICDYNLPDSNEGEAIDYIISKNIPVIVLTASYDADLRDKMLSKKIADYVVKRSTKDLDYLASTVKRILKNCQIKILVVDDSSVYRDAMYSILSNQLYHVLIARGGKDALYLIEQNPDIKMVITDYNMPDIDGFEVLVNIRMKYKKDKMAIIVTSGFTGNDEIPKFLKAGANDYIQKPFSAEEFICRINMNIETLEMIETLRDFAYKDPMTGLSNRRYFFETGIIIHATAKRNNVKLAVFMFDIDKFKSINDTYGHDAGDIAIKSLAQILSSSFKRKTDIVARFGGEEFCILTTYEDEDNLLTFAETIRQTIEQHSFDYLGHTIRFTSSVGICKTHLSTLELMIKEADDRLYEAKNSGRNRVCIN
ncbi:MAG: diguanylate cyclase [Thermodesulfovibrionales bacterium]|nr:diguanylate cyclase [Thermodesulfovibrionales bacterium]